MQRTLNGIAALALMAMSASAQTPPQEPTQAPTFRTTVDLVPVDVSVLDNSGRPGPRRAGIGAQVRLAAHTGGPSWPGDASWRRSADRFHGQPRAGAHHAWKSRRTGLRVPGRISDRDAGSGRDKSR